MEPARRVLGVRVARPRRVLRHRRVRDRHRVPARGDRERIRAVPRPAARRGRRRPRIDPDRVGRVPDARLHVRDRHVDVPLRRAAAGVQPARVDQRVAGDRDGGTSVPRRDVRTSVLPGDAGVVRRVDAGLLVRAEQQARAHAVRDPGRRGPRPRRRRPDGTGQAHHVRHQRRSHGDDRRGLGVLPHVHLSAVRDRPLDHDRHGADGVSGRERARCGDRRSGRPSWFRRSSTWRTGWGRVSSTWSGTPPCSSWSCSCSPAGSSRPSAIGSRGRAPVAPAAPSAATDRVGRSIRRQEREPRDDRCAAPPRGAGPPEAFRRRRRRRRMFVQRSAGDRDRVDRPERLRQDDGVQRGDRVPARRLRHGPLRRARRSPSRSLPPVPVRPLAHLPANTRVPQAHPDREPRRRGATTAGRDGPQADQRR